jgi:hypothetical protein
MSDPDAQRFSISSVRSHGGIAALRPLLPLTLTSQGRSAAVHGLLDSGADVNVLPFPLGLRLGATWESAQPRVQLSGNLARVEARAIIVDAQIGELPSVRLAFAWTRAEDTPLLLGQVNFFAEFDVCFFRSLGQVEIRPRPRG